MRRTDLIEIMDDPAVDRPTLDTSLKFIRRVNRRLGGTAAVLDHLRLWSRQQNWASRRETITLLDVATGSADIPLAILDWAAAGNLNLHVHALDANAIMLQLAREYVTRAWRHTAAPPIDFLQGDALRLPFADRSVDYATCSMFFHHLADAQAVAALKELLRVSRRGVIVNDLLRTTFARIGIHLLTLFAAHVDKHDARISVAKAWTRREVEQWPKAANAPWLVYHHHVPARFTLAGLHPGS